MRRSRLVLVLLAPVAAAALGCQALNELTTPTSSPSPSPSASPSASPIAIPVVKPTPVPTPTPTPTPTPGPTPTPEPTPTPDPGCSLPASNPSSPLCVNDPARLASQVEAAQTAATEAKPGLFDFNQKVCNNCYRVVDINGYIAEVQRQLAILGVCTHWDGEEIAAKNSNSFSEQYDVLLASEHVRWGDGMYRGVCRPAIF